MYGKKKWLLGVWLALAVLFLPAARAGCVPANQVAEWLTTDLQGRPGLLGYRYRIKQKTFECKAFASSHESVAKTTMLIYQGLPEGVAMVEYWAKPADLEPDSRGPTSYTDEDLQTMLFVGAPLDGAAARAVAELLDSGRVEFFFVRYGVDLPQIVEEKLPKVVLFARIDPGRIPSLLAVGGAVFSPLHLDWASQIFLGVQAAGR